MHPGFLALLASYATPTSGLAGTILLNERTVLAGGDRRLHGFTFWTPVVEELGLMLGFSLNEA